MTREESIYLFCFSLSLSLSLSLSSFCFSLLPSLLPPLLLCFSLLSPSFSLSFLLLCFPPPFLSFFLCSLGAPHASPAPPLAPSPSLGHLGGQLQPYLCLSFRCLSLLPTSLLSSPLPQFDSFSLYRPLALLTLLLLPPWRPPLPSATLAVSYNLTYVP